MTKLSIGAMGQITLPENMVRHLDLQPGEKLVVRKLPNRRIEIAAAHPTGSISDTFGLLKKDGRRSLSIERIDKITARGWAGKR